MSLNNSCKSNKHAIILCDENQIIKSLSYNEMISIREKLKTMLYKNFNERNICVCLIMDHNIYIPSLILSIHDLECSFMFLTTKNFDKIVGVLKVNWILTFEDVEQIQLFQELNRLALGDKSLILWKRSDPPSTTLNFQNIFCVVQTSGSTGENKLIKVTNTCIETNVSCLRKTFDIKSSDIILWGTNLTFDPSIIELLVALQSGASLLIVPKRVLINPKVLYTALFKVAKITFLQMVPSVFFRWSKDQIKQILVNPQLRILAFGGEHFPRTILSYERKNDLRIFNLYGISEVSCWATMHEITHEVQDDAIPIGNNLEDTIVELRDEFGKAIRRGKGEIFIGSSSRKCYINDESPTDVSGTVFRGTGDIAEAIQEGIFLIGRKNKIVKRFGHKINLAKVESKILEVTGLENRCVWSQENKMLLFVLMKNLDVKLKKKTLDKLTIKLVNTLTEESFPDYIDIVTNFPLTSHGKVNEKALEKQYSVTKTPVCTDIFQLLWCKYLGVSDENMSELRCFKFLELGGNSISALQLLTEFRERIECECPNEFVSMIFENRYEECLKYLENLKPIKKISNDKIPECHFPGKMKLTDNLKILWSYDLKACVDSGPLVFKKGQETYVAVGSFSHKFVVFHENGKVIYEATLPDSIESTPCISQCANFLLVGCCNGVMYCIDPFKRQIMWEFTTGSKIKSSVCFDVNQSTGTFGSYDKFVYCISLEGGSKRWNTLLDGSICANPICNDTKKSVYVATTKGSCFCLKKDNGQVMWKTNCNGPIFGTPCLANADEHVIVPTVQGILLCLHVENGDLIWKYQVDGHIFSSIVFSNNQILFGCHDKNIYVLNTTLSECSLSKKIMLDSEISTTPFLYTINGKSMIVTPCNSGLVSVIDFGTFELLRRIQLPAEVFSSPFVYNNRIFVGCRDNNFYCIELNE